jgi:hypothetical protein
MRWDKSLTRFDQPKKVNETIKPKIGDNVIVANEKPVDNKIALITKTRSTKKANSNEKTSSTEPAAVRKPIIIKK